MTLELALWIIAGLWLLGTGGRKLTTDSLGFRFVIAFIAWPWLGF